MGARATPTGRIGADWGVKISPPPSTRHGKTFPTRETPSRVRRITAAPDFVTGDGQSSPGSSQSEKRDEPTPELKTKERRWPWRVYLLRERLVFQDLIVVYKIILFHMSQHGQISTANIDFRKFLAEKVLRDKQMCIMVKNLVLPSPQPRIQTSQLIAGTGALAHWAFPW